MLPVLQSHIQAQGGLQKPAPGERWGTGVTGATSAFPPEIGLYLPEVSYPSAPWYFGCLLHIREQAQDSACQRPMAIVPESCAGLWGRHKGRWPQTSPGKYCSWS